MNEFVYSEGKIAAAAGISRYDMRHLREKYLGEFLDWKNLGGKRGGVGYTLEGAQMIVQQFPKDIDLEECKIPAPPGPGEIPVTPNWGEKMSPRRLEDLSVALNAGNGVAQLTPAPPAQTLQKMTVFKLVPNPRVVLAKDQYGEIQTVWVGKSQNFVVGDDIEVAPHETYGDTWRFTGVMPKDRRRQRLRAS